MQHIQWHSINDDGRSPRGSIRPGLGGRARRLTAVAAIAMLPLFAAACATSATSTGAAAGGSVSSSPAGPAGSQTTTPESADPGTAQTGTAQTGTAQTGTDGSITGGSSTGGSSSDPVESTGRSSQSPPDSSLPQSPPSEVPEPGSNVPSELSGSAFTSTTFTGRAAVDGAPLTISFTRDRRVGLFAGCNSMGGQAVFSGSSFRVPRLVSTRLACVKANGSGGEVMPQESWYSQWLMAGVTYSLDGATLTLTGGGVSVQFQRTGDAGTPAGGGTSGSTAGDPSGGAGIVTADPGPVASGSTPLPGATLQPSPRGTAVPIPSTNK